MKNLLSKILNYLVYEIGQIKSDSNYSNIYEKYRGYTMIPQDTYIANLELCEKFSGIDGVVIECGTWKGGMIAGMAEILGINNRSYYLFDSFEGLPQAKQIDGTSAIKWQNNVTANNYYDNCKAGIEFAQDAMNKSGAKQVFIIKGWFENTLIDFEIDSGIAILRLDGDWYDSIYCCMERLYPKVVKRGLIIIDDYYVWDGTSRAIHDYLSKICSASKIYSLHGGVAYIIKEDKDALYS